MFGLNMEVSGIVGCSAANSKRSSAKIDGMTVAWRQTPRKYLILSNTTTFEKQ